MSVIEHIKEIVSPGAAEKNQAWAAQWFPSAQRATAIGIGSVVVALAGGDLERLTADTRLTEDLSLNELQHVQLIVAIEEQFNVEILESDTNQMHTIAQLVECVHSKPPKTVVIESVGEH